MRTYLYFLVCAFICIAIIFNSAQAELQISVTGDTSPPAKAYAGYYKACIESDFQNIYSLLASKNQAELDYYEWRKGYHFQWRREAMIETLKMRPLKIKISQPIVTTDRASFTVEGMGENIKKAIGSIKMIIEHGKWKVLEDKWEIIYE